jgi:hypothetical protein
VNASSDATALEAIAAVLRDPPGARGWDAIRAALEATGRPVPSVRRFLDLSTVHLPQATLLDLSDLPGVVADPTPFGAWLWVPCDVEESAEWDPPPPEVLAIQTYARALGCDWVLFDADAPTTSALPTFDWD